MSARGSLRIRAVLIAIVVVGLAVDAYVHFDLASAFKANKTSVMSEADIFRADSVVAIIAALALLVRPNRYTAGFAFLVAAAGTVAVVLTRYVNIGKIGPIPNLYDPFWLPTEKWVSAIFEAAAAVAALALLVLASARSRGVSPHNYLGDHAHKS
jgi:hypothetical protein